MRYLLCLSFTGDDGLFQTLWVEGLATGHSLERSRRVHFVVYAGILVGVTHRDTTAAFSSFICLDVSVVRFCKTSLTCLGPEERPPYSESAARFQHASDFLWKAEVGHMQAVHLVLCCFN